MFLLLPLACVLPDDSASKSCPDLGTYPTPVAACFDVAGDADTASWTQALDFDGVVVSVGSGAPSEGCVVQLGTLDAGATWFVVRGEGDVLVTVGVEAPGATPVAVDDVVHVVASFTPGEFGPNVGQVAVYGEGDALRVFVGEGGAPSDLTPPTGVSLLQGDATCTDEDQCGSWSFHALDVTVDGSSASVARGETTVVGAASVTLGELVGGDGQTSCPDWFVADFRVSVAR